MEIPYDSRADTMAHIKRVSDLLLFASSDLIHRSINHDKSKLKEPEKSLFDKYTPLLKDSVYMSDEYKGFLKKLSVALDHHYEHNSHHPEHYDTYHCPMCSTHRTRSETFVTGLYTPDIRFCKVCTGGATIFEASFIEEDLTPGINGMNLFDLIEMFLDWKAAGERDSGGNIYKSIELNKDRFKISDQLAKILVNTADYLGFRASDKGINQ